MSVGENAEKNMAVKDTATNYAFARLGDALFQIASCAIGNCAPAGNEEGGDKECSTNDLPVVIKSRRLKIKPKSNKKGRKKCEH